MKKFFKILSLGLLLQSLTANASEVVTVAKPILVNKCYVEWYENSFLKLSKNDQKFFTEWLNLIPKISSIIEHAVKLQTEPKNAFLDEKIKLEISELSDSYAKLLKNNEIDVMPLSVIDAIKKLEFIDQAKLDEL